MVRAKAGFGFVRALFTAAAMLALVACGGGGGGGGSPGGTNPGGGSNASDTAPPDTTIVTKPEAVTNSTTAGFTFSSTEAGSTFEVSVDGAAFASSGASFDIPGVAEGEHTLSVRAIDAAKNVDASPATATWRVDITAPTAQVLFPPAHSYTDANQVTLRGTVSDPYEPTVKVNGIDATIAPDGTWTSVQTVATGENTFVVSTTDEVGNTNATAATVLVRNNGPAMSYVPGMDFDPTHHRLLLADFERRQILAIDSTTGISSVFAGYDSASAAPLTAVSNVALDAAHSRLIAVDYLGDQLVGIDLTNGTRDLLSDSNDSTYGLTNFPTGGRFVGIAIDSQGDFAYMTRGRDAALSTEPGVMKVDLRSGARTVVSGMGGGNPAAGGPTFPSLGTGPSFNSPTDVVVDQETTPTRLLVSDGQTVFAVDPSNGDRTVFFDGTATLGQITRMKLDGHGKLLVSTAGSNLPHGVFAIDLASPAANQVASTSALQSQADGVYALACDSAHSRVYMSAIPTLDIYGADLSGGEPTLLAHANIGTGPQPMIPTSVVKVGNVLYFAELRRRALLKLDLTTGVRSVVSSDAVGSGPSFAPFGNFAIDEVNHRALAPGFEAPNSEALLAVDLSTGDRTVLSDNSLGAGPNFRRPTLIAWDAAANRTLVVDTDGFDPTLLSVDEQGNRAVLSNLDIGSSITALSGIVLDRSAGSTNAIVTLGAQFSPGTPYSVDLNTGDVSAIPTAQAFGLWMHPTEHALLMADGLGISLYDFTNDPRLVSGRGSGGAVAGSGIDMLYPDSVFADPEANVAYVTDTFMYGLFAIDLTSGERVLISR
ncbi:MAG TPA: hypothetical protein VFS47_16045 [Steroidobacteraceae bacterium]|nr:hypothetical protein [Steroidobacteraceae bacterium]